MRLRLLAKLESRHHFEKDKLLQRGITMALAGPKIKRITYKIIFFVGAAQQNPATFNSTIKDIEVAVSKWLLGTRDRGGRRSLRQKRKLPQEDETVE